jgi:MFS family permease
LLLSTVVYTPFSRLPEEDFLSWGWRIPFLLSILLVVVGLLIRARILETPAFSRIKEQREEARMPVLEVFRHYPREVLVAMGARLAENGAFYLYTVFVLIYGTQHVGMDRNIVLTGIMIAAAIELITIPLFGALSDVVGRKPVYLFGSILTGILGFPLFWMMDSATPALVWLGLVLVLSVGHSAMYAPQGAFFSELFGARVRYSGASLGAQLASVIAGGLSPAIATTFLEYGYGRGAMSLYVIVMAVITTIAVASARETLRHDIDHAGRK